jgi:DNA-binding CsgD family transcriptional regulator
MRQGLLAFADLGRELDVHAALVDLVRVALEAEQPVLAARLLGVAAAYPAYSASFPPLHQQDASVSSRGVAETQSRLGEVAYTSEFDAGRRLTWDEALAEIDALIETVLDATVASPPTPATVHGLSRRQVEVLKLITEGRSSREIAETLSLSERTIENHVFHIFTKLKVTSRAAAAAYAVRLGLTS